MTESPLQMVAAVVEQLMKAQEVQFALIGDIGSAVIDLLADTDPEAAERLGERFRMAAEVLNQE